MTNLAYYAYFFLKNSKENEKVDQRIDRKFYIYIQKWPAPSENSIGSEQ